MGEKTEAGAGGAGSERGELYMSQLLQLALHGKAAGHVVAIGEIGLDWDRTNFCPKDVQLEWFERQLVGLAAKVDLPLFLHCRAAGDDMLAVLRRHGVSNGVVHSFDGPLATMQALVQQGLYIGVNGCSLRTEDNLGVVAQIPADRLLLETDGPWCDIRKTHPGHVHVRTEWPTVTKPKKWVEGKCVRSRQEPCHLRQVLEVCAGVRGVDPDVLAQQVYENTCRLFFPTEASGAVVAAAGGTAVKTTGSSSPLPPPPPPPPPSSSAAGHTSKGGSAAASQLSLAAPAFSPIPIGHTAFSWTSTGPLAIGHTHFSWSVGRMGKSPSDGSARVTSPHVARARARAARSTLEEAQPFALDDDFDYDNVELSQRKQTVNGWEESPSGRTFQDFVRAAGGEAALEQQLTATVAKGFSTTSTDAGNQ